MCTRVDFIPTDLTPGQNLSVIIHFDPPASEIGFVERRVTFQTSDLRQPSVSAWLQAFVTQSVGWWPAQLILKVPQKPGTQVQQNIQLVNLSDHPVYFVGTSRPVNAPILQLPPKIAPHQQIAVELSWGLPRKPGTYQGLLKVKLDRGTPGVLVFNYSATVVASDHATTSRPSRSP